MASHWVEQLNHQLTTPKNLLSAVMSNVTSRKYLRSRRSLVLRWERMKAVCCRYYDFCFRVGVITEISSTFHSEFISPEIFPFPSRISHKIESQIYIHGMKKATMYGIKKAWNSRPWKIFLHKNSSEQLKLVNYDNNELANLAMDGWEFE